MSENKKRKTEAISNRPFQDWWTDKYGMMKSNNNALCALCGNTVVCRTSSVKRHYETTHSFLLSKSDSEQKEYIAREVKNKNFQSKSFTTFLKHTNYLVAASFEVSKTIATHSKPFSDGDYIKEAFIKCAPHLFEDFQNKEQILKRIEELSISRNTVKDRILKMHKNINIKKINDIRTAKLFSICLDESTDVTSSARLSIIARYAKGEKIVEELLSLVSLSAKTTGKDISDAVIKTFQIAEIDTSTIVSITTDGAPSMIGRQAGFVSLFQEHVGHPIINFHCIIHQEVLCAKSGLAAFDDILSIVSKIINFIAARALNKRQFQLLLQEVGSNYHGLLMYNHVRWLSRGFVLQRFVECFDEIIMFLNDKKTEFPELFDNNWITKLMFLTDISNHLNELNIKLQGPGKSIDVMFDIIEGFESKLVIFKRDIDNNNFKYFPLLKDHLQKFSIHGVYEININFYSQVISGIQDNFVKRFEDFKIFAPLINFIKYPDKFDMETAKIDQLDWLQLENLEMQLAEFQSSSIWKLKFIELRQEIENNEKKRLNEEEYENMNNMLLKTWCSLPETFNAMKKLSLAILTIFSSTYSCESLFSIMNNIKSDVRNRLTDECGEACISLKLSNYDPDIDALSRNIQQQKSH